MITLKNFTKNDYFCFMGAEKFENGDLPRIYYFSDAEVEEFFNLMGISNDQDGGNWAYLLHHNEGFVLGWFYGDEFPEVCWKAGDSSEKVEHLLEKLDSETLPLWAASVASVEKRF